MGDLKCDFHGTLEVEFSVGDELADAFSLHHLHGDVGLPLALSDLVDRADVRVVQSGSGSGLAEEPGPCGRVLEGVGRQAAEAAEALVPPRVITPNGPRVITS